MDFQNIEFQELHISHIDKCLKFWSEMTELSTKEESFESINHFIKRNSSLSFVAIDQEKLIGTIMASNDGRRGYLYHLAVDPHYRRYGVGQKLTSLSLDSLKKLNIEKVHLFSFGDINHDFWEKQGFSRRDDLIIRSKIL